MNDPLFTATNCQRCNKTLGARIMSWFTEEIICTDCSTKETIIKQHLRSQGISNAMEGCGYVPTIEK